jgi:hypothetical protein
LPILATRRFTGAEQLRYDFLMKMFGGRLDLKQLASRYGESTGRIRRMLWRELLFFHLAAALKRPSRLGARRNRSGVVELNRKGYYLVVVLMREFFTGVNNFREACLSRGGTNPTGVKP